VVPLTFHSALPRLRPVIHDCPDYAVR
jgi:hypothetical protein